MKTKKLLNGCVGICLGYCECKLIYIPSIAQDLWWKTPTTNDHWPGNDQNSYGERMLFYLH